MTAGARTRHPQVPARRGRRDHQGRHARCRATTSSASLARIGPPNVIEDLLSIGAVLQAREALDTLGSRLPGHMRVFGESQIASVSRRAQRSLAADPAVAAVRAVAGHAAAAAPWQIIRLAIKMAASDDEIRVAATPYGVAVTIALHDLSFLAACLRTDIRRGHFDNVAEHLKIAA